MSGHLSGPKQKVSWCRSSWRLEGQWSDKRNLHVAQCVYNGDVGLCLYTTHVLFYMYRDNIVSLVLD